MQLDVSDLSSANKFADEIKATHDRLHLLINNAGVMAVPFSTTVDGYERQFATNHLGYFALTAKLFPLLKQSTPSRVVKVSSIAHKDATLARFVSGAGIMHADEKNYRALRVGLSSRSHGDQPHGRAGHGRQQNQQAHVAHWRDDSPAPRRPDGDAAHAVDSVDAATGADVESDYYYGASRLWEIKGPPKRVQALAIAHDEAAAKNLWDESERLTKVKFDAVHHVGRFNISQSF
ncbi:hypothetical protein ON010_g14942 [Phytophthora cinnamomi]|nr:hypothetical protein ON010_g14942 [Phytophthora cinnamomi]